VEQAQIVNEKEKIADRGGKEGSEFAGAGSLSGSGKFWNAYGCN